MIHSLEFMSLDEARVVSPTEPSIAISILSPRYPAISLSEEFRDILQLRFEDSTPADGCTEQGGFFTKNQARQIIEFIRTYHSAEQTYHLLIHCEAGISRSAAVAVFAASECRVPLSGQFAFLNPWVLKVLVNTAYPHYAF